MVKKEDKTNSIYTHVVRPILALVERVCCQAKREKAKKQVRL